MDRKRLASRCSTSNNEAKFVGSDCFESGGLSCIVATANLYALWVAWVVVKYRQNNHRCPADGDWCQPVSGDQAGPLTRRSGGETWLKA